MPAAIPLVAAAAGAATTAAIGTGIFATAAGAIVATGINAIGSRALAKKPKAMQFGQEAQGRSFAVRNSIETHKIIYGTARVAGPLTFIKTVDAGLNSALQGVSGDNLFYHYVFPVACHEIEDVTGVYINDQPCTLDGSDFVIESPYFDGGFSYVRVTKYLGSPNQEASVNLQSECGLTAAHRGRGIAYLYVRLQYKADVFPLGPPNISAVVKGKKVYDPRTGATAWTQNAALCIRDYLTSRDGSQLDEPYGFGIDNGRIDDAAFIAAANVCDEPVALNGGGTQPRYTCNGVVDTGVGRLDNLTSLLTSLAGTVTQVGDKFRIHAAAYDSPVATITPDSFVSGLKVNTRTPRKDLFNSIRGVYIDPNKGWQPTDFPMMAFGNYETLDGGERLPKDIELPFTIHPEAAQRIGKVLLEKGRQGLMVEFAMMHDAIRFSVFDVVALTVADYGWEEKPFRIIDWQWPDAPSGAIQLRLQEESAASYDWNTGMVLGYDAAPDTNLPNPFSVAAPGTPAVSEELYAPLDGSAVRSRALVTWAASTSAFVKEYQLEIQPITSVEWAIAGRTPNTSLTINDIAEGSYRLRVKAFNSIGVGSAYAEGVATINGLSAPPQPITGFSLNAIHNNAHLSWDQSPDIDVRIGGSIRLRYSKDTSGATWSGAIDLGPALSGVATQAPVPLLNGTYLIKAVDSAGNESISATSIVSTVADIVKMNNVISSPQHSSFSGTKTNMLVVSGNLKLDGSGVFDDGAGDFDDALGYFDSGGTGGFAPYGEYLFSHSGNDYIDVGKVVTCRLTADIKSTVVNELDTFDERGGMFDDALGLFEGDDITGVEPKFYVRTTPDNPAGSPTWSEWRQFFVGDYTARAFQIKLGVQSTDPALNVEIEELSVTVDMPDVTDTGSLTTGTGGRTTVNFAKTFYATPKVGGTILNAASGDYFDIQSISATSFQIGVKDAGGSFVARTVHWTASGY